MAPNHSLHDRLANPAGAIPALGLAERWFEGRVRVRAEGEGALARRADIAHKLRGGLGDRLMETASAGAIAGAPCPWRPPCAFDLMWREQGRLSPRAPIPKPWVIEVAADGGDLIADLTLFGFATDWLEAAAETWTRVFRIGLDLPGGRRPLAVAGRDISVAEGAPSPGAPAAALVSLVTPTLFRQQSREVFTRAALFEGLKNRAEGLARWFDVRLDEDFEALRAAWETGVDVELDIARAPLRVRRSGRPGGGRAPIGGWTGTVTLSGALAPFAPLLAIAERAHLGARTALGYGALHIAWRDGPR